MSGHTYIDTPEQLAAALPAIRTCSVLCVDTEFHREKTYYPEFALMQIYGDKQCWIIDPVNLDLAPLWEVICDPAILKVFHAGRQDLEIIFAAAGKLPLPLFDTQVAAALLGMGQQIGFGNLVQRILKKTLAKQESFSDWLARPLTAKQLEYAADDVIYLMPIYKHLKERLEARQRLGWLDEEQETLTSESTYADNLDEVFWRVKGCNKLKGKQLAALRELAAWREKAAQQRNLPRRRMMSDEILVEIARKEKVTAEGLERIRGMSGGTVKRFGDELIACWKKGVESAPDSWPKLKARALHHPGTDIRQELLDSLVELKAVEQEIAANILASQSDLADLASWGHRCKGEPPKLAILHGWRYELVGHDLIRLLKGEICLHMDVKTGLPAIAPWQS